MAAPLYFIEGVEVVNQAIVDACQLGYALSAGFVHRGSQSGPGESGGAACSMSADRLGFFPDDQEWVNIGERGGRRCWLGWRRGEIPGPDDLLRPTAIAGESLKLFDDREWSVPRAIAWQNDGMSLVSPAAVEWRDGKWYRGGVKSAYRRLDAIGRDFWNRFMTPLDDPAKELQVAEVMDMASEALGVNYRVSRYEVGAFGLFDAGCCVPLEVMKCVIDYGGYITHRAFVNGDKKKATDDASTGV